MLPSKTAEGNSYADLCIKDLDGVTCEQPFRSVIRFWGGNFTKYEVRNGWYTLLRQSFVRFLSVSVSSNHVLSILAVPP